MIKGSFVRLIQKDERAATRIHERLMKFLVYVEVRKGKLKRKKMTIQDLAEIEMSEDDKSDK